MNGAIVVDESSLSVAAQGERDRSLAGYTRVEEHQPRLNYGTHMKREKSERWTEEETCRWYKVGGGERGGEGGG